MKAVGTQATAACGNFNLCAGLQAGIKGAIHAVRAVFSDPSLLPTTGSHPLDHPPSPHLTPPPDRNEMTMDDAIDSIVADAGMSDQEQASALLLVDATNGFNELSRKAMLWTIRHRWANGALNTVIATRHNLFFDAVAIMIVPSSLPRRRYPR